MGTLNAKLHAERRAKERQRKPPCLHRAGCKRRKCPKRCGRYVPDLR